MYMIFLVGIYIYVYILYICICHYMIVLEPYFSSVLAIPLVCILFSENGVGVCTAPLFPSYFQQFVWQYLPWRRGIAWWWLARWPGGMRRKQSLEDRMANLEVGVGAAADAAFTAKRKEEMAASEAAAEIQRMKRGYLIKVRCGKEVGFAPCYAPHMLYIYWYCHFTPFVHRMSYLLPWLAFCFVLVWMQLLDEEKSEERLLKNASVGTIGCQATDSNR